MWVLFLRYLGRQQDSEKAFVMAVLIKVLLKQNEKLICEECGHEIVEGETAILDLDYMRESPEKIYCSSCRSPE